MSSSQCGHQVILTKMFSFSAEISNSGMYQVPSMPGTPHMDHKSFHGSMMIRGNPHAHNHKMVMAENGAPSHLPMRDPKRSTLPHGHSAKDSSMSPRKDDGLACCSGHFVVLWIILGIITFGILLGVVLMFTVGWILWIRYISDLYFCTIYCLR